MTPVIAPVDSPVSSANLPGVQGSDCDIIKSAHL
jgi:hypothetical protein